MRDKIRRWGITWRESTPTNLVVSLGVNGNLGSAIMMSHDMTLLALTSIANALVALLVVHPIRPGDGEDNYIAVVLNVKLYHMELWAGA